MNDYFLHLVYGELVFLFQSEVVEGVIFFQNKVKFNFIFSLFMTAPFQVDIKNIQPGFKDLVSDLAKLEQLLDLQSNLQLKNLISFAQKKIGISYNDVRKLTEDNFLQIKNANEIKEKDKYIYIIFAKKYGIQAFSDQKIDYIKVIQSMYSEKIKFEEQLPDQKIENLKSQFTNLQEQIQSLLRSCKSVSFPGLGETTKICAMDINEIYKYPSLFPIALNDFWLNKMKDYPIVGDLFKNQNLNQTLDGLFAEPNSNKEFLLLKAVAKFYICLQIIVMHINDYYHNIYVLPSFNDFYSKYIADNSKTN